MQGRRPWIFFAALALALLVAAGLHRAYPDAPAVQAFDRGLRALLQAVGGGGSTELHKCVTTAGTEYRSDACPGGSRETALTHGTVTTLPATPVARPASAAASIPNARELLSPSSDEPTLLDKRIERATGGG
ncbi:MAG: hypothetical protein JO224_04175 [Pelomonas sp.]|nr:hypothetical protein [Roseateles sp.]